MALIKLALGLNRVKPVHELLVGENGFCECSELQNFIARDNKIKKVGGTEAYNSSALTTGIPWLHKTYHKRADDTFTKVLLCFSNGKLYYGDDLAGTWTQVKAGLSTGAIPTHATMQVSGNSILYIFTGEDEVVKYDGNGSFNFEETTLNSSLGRTIESAVLHLDRFWYVSKNSSFLAYATTLQPEDLTTDAADIIIGEEKDSIIRRAVVGGNEKLYVFKSNSIYELYGRTPSTFEFRRVTDRYGLAAKRAIHAVGGGFVFLNEYDKELYFFGGTESSIQPMTEDTIRLRDIIDEQSVQNTDMTVHDGLFRFTFKHKDDNYYNNHELIYPINEPRPDGTPKWSLTKGADIWTYALLQLQGDKNILMSGRHSVGKAMYHNRGFDFDDASIEIIVRTAEVVASEDKQVRFKGFYVKGKPGSQNHPVEFRYFLDARYATTNMQNLDTSGELRTLGSIKLSTQALFNNRIIPMTGFSKGNSISFSLYDKSVASDLEIYSISVKTQERSKIRNLLVG